MTAPDAALAELLGALKDRDYAFTAVTPATHARVIARPAPAPPSLRDIFGWSRPFGRGELEPDLLRLLADAGMLLADGEQLRSAIRVASAGGQLFLHSAYPTQADDAVFFGPDTYRFLRFLDHHLQHAGQVRHLVDMGTGSGAGGIHAAGLCAGARVTLIDINPQALRLACINAGAAAVEVAAVQGSELAMADGSIDLVVANPPYMIDEARRAYRDGGGLLGGEIALRWAGQALQRLGPSGRMLLYTGAAVVGGQMPLAQALTISCETAGASLQIEEIDPDVFGEELDSAAYLSVDRIAAVGAVISRR